MIGNMIQTKRKEVGLTQAQLAELLGVTPPAVNRWEKDLSFPDATLLAPLARCLRTDLNELFSFYDSLSDKERELIEKKAWNLIVLEDPQEGLNYIDEVLKNNLSDGELYFRFAKLLSGAHVLKKNSDPMIFLERIVKYYERAKELLPEKTDMIAYSLITLYAEMGDKIKAEESWSQLLETNYDKPWAHAEMLYSLKEYDLAVIEAKKLLLEQVIDLSRNINFLCNAYSLAGDNEMSEAANAINEDFQKLFGLWGGIGKTFQVVNEIENNTMEKDPRDVSRFFESSDLADGLSTCPLFKDVDLGSLESENLSTAQHMLKVLSSINGIKALSEKMGIDLTSNLDFLESSN